MNINNNPIVHPQQEPPIVQSLSSSEVINTNCKVLVGFLFMSLMKLSLYITLTDCYGSFRFKDIRSSK
jgi:hypothetical protein